MAEVKISHKPNTPNWYSAYCIESSYSLQPSIEDIRAHDKATNSIADSSLSRLNKTRVSTYLKMGRNSGNRFAVTQSEAIANKYLKNEIGEDHFNFEKRLMEAWCSRTITSFIDKESLAMDGRNVTVQEKEMAKKMLQAAKKKSDIVMAFASLAMRAYYSGANEKERISLLSDAMSMVEGAPDRS